MVDQAGQTANMWEDPNLMSIILGMIGQAAMGQYGQQTWQSQLGGAATALGRSRKTALAAEEMGRKRETREAEWLDIVRSLVGGGKTAGAEAEGLGLSSTMLSAEMRPYAGIEQRTVEREKRPYPGPYGGGQLNLSDVLGR